MLVWEHTKFRGIDEQGNPEFCAGSDMRFKTLFFSLRQCSPLAVASSGIRALTTLLGREAGQKYQNMSAFVVLLCLKRQNLYHFSQTKRVMVAQW